MRVLGWSRFRRTWRKQRGLQTQRGAGDSVGGVSALCVRCGERVIEHPPDARDQLAHILRLN